MINTDGIAKLSKNYSFGADCPYFNGHFTNNPILPGIIQIRLVSQIIQDSYNDFTLYEILKAKFLKPIGADDAIAVEIIINFVSERLLKCQGTLSVRGDTVASISLTFRNVGL